MSTEQQGEAAPPRYERWQSPRTGGYRCEICGYELGKPDEYAVIQTHCLQAGAILMLYGTVQPDALTILCCVCERVYRSDTGREQLRKTCVFPISEGQGQGRA